MIFFSGSIFLAGAILASYFFIPKKSIEIGNQGKGQALESESDLQSQEEKEKLKEDQNEIALEKTTSTSEDNLQVVSLEEDKKSQNISYPPVEEKLTSWGYEKKANRDIDTIIIHTSYDALHENDPYSIEGIIEEFRPYEVAAHYIIGRDGRVVRTVREEDVAYHAGVSKVPDGRTGVNYFSIGIEMVNDKESQLTDTQYKILNQLLEALKNKYSIKYILGHNEIAPERKTDPWNFDWSRIER